MLVTEEQELIDHLGYCGQLFQRLVQGPYASEDLAVVGHHLAALQYMVLAQAGARAHPDRYSLLGGLPAGPPADEERQHTHESPERPLEAPESAP